MKIILAIALVGSIICFYYWNRRPIQRTPKEITDLLEARLRGDEDPGEWDYFRCCTIRDERLESIRSEVERIEVIGSEYLENKNGNPFQLSEKGIKRFQELVKQCKELV